MGQAGTQYRELAFSIGCPIKTKGEQALNKSQQYATDGRRTPFPWLLRRHSKVAAVLSVINKGEHMTQAVCFNCGELKFGSFTECENCHRTPENDADKQRFISEMKDARKNNDLVKALEGIRQSKSQTKESKGFLKNLIALLVLIAMGVSFISAVVALFNGEIMGSIGLFVLSAILNGIAKGLNA